MGIFDFLKKVLKEEEKIEPEKEKVTFSNIEEFTKSKIKDIIEKEKERNSLINQTITHFTKEIRDKIDLVNKVDIESKEKNDKIKTIVNEGRKKYVDFLERFIENIEDIEKENIEETAKEINQAFLRLNQNSGKSYERATILIGKEMGSIKETLKNFSNELLRIFNENKDITSDKKKLQLIQLKIQENKEINKKLGETKEDISSIEKKVKEKEEESKKNYNEIEKIKNSKEYLEYIEKEKEVQLKEENLEKNINELRVLIDFKGLSNFFHIFPDKMEIVKKYKDNFLSEFKMEGEEKILTLLNESKLNNNKIDEKINTIKEKEKEIFNSKQKIKKVEVEHLYSEIERIKERIDNLINEKEWAEKNKNKMESQEKENKDTIKKQLISMNINPED
jgi:hypothetical protein